MTIIFICIKYNSYRIKIPFPKNGKGTLKVITGFDMWRSRFDYAIAPLSEQGATTQPAEYYKLYNFHLFLFLELAHVQVIIETSLLKQFIMLAAFDDLAIFQDKDHVRIPDCG